MRILLSGWGVLHVKVELVTTPKIPMTAPSLRCVGFGVRIAVWFRCNSNKVAENGSNQKLYF